MTVATSASSLLHSSIFLFTLAPIVLITLLLLLSSRLLRTPTFPSPSILFHLILSLFLLPFVDFSARLWLLQPFLPVLLFLLISLFILAIAVAALLYSLSSSLNQLGALAYALISTLAENGVSDDFGEAFDHVSDAFRNLVDSINVTEFLSALDLPPGAQDALRRATESGQLLDKLNVTDVLENTALPQVVEQALRKGTAAFAGFIANVSVDEIVKDSNVPPEAYEALASLKVAITDLVTNVDVGDVVRNAHVPSTVRDSFASLQDALFELRDKVNYTEVFFKANLTSSTADAWSGLSQRLDQGDAGSLLSTLGNGSFSESAINAVQAFSSCVPFNLRYIFATQVFLFLAVVPFLFVARAALHELVKWLVTSRYRSSGGVVEGTRDVRGWLLSAVIAGLGFAAAEAIPLSMALGALHGGGLLPRAAAVVIVVHILAVVPMHAAAQIRVAAAAARKDVMKIATASVPAAFFWSILVHAGVNLWWHYFGVVLAVAGAGWPAMAWKLLVVDAGVFFGVVVWASRVCSRVIDEERKYEEEQRHQKED